MFYDDIIGALLIAVCAVVVTAFAVSGILYRKAKESAESTGAVKDIEKMQTFRSVFRVTGIIIAVFVITAVILGVLFYWFIMNM